MKTIKKISVIIILVLIVAGIVYKLYAVKQQKMDEIKMVDKIKSAIPITTTTVNYEEVNQDFTYQGTFEPNCEVTISSESQGKVVAYYFNEGDFVSEGNTIAILDNELLGYQLEIAEAAYLKAQNDLKRYENLCTGVSVSEQQMDEIKLAYKNAKSNYFTIKKQFDNTKIKAPVSGTISKRYIEKGSLLAPGNPVADIVDIRKMKFIARFTATDLASISIGQKVNLSATLYPDILYSGTIKVMGVKPDNSKRYLVQIEVLNKSEKPLIAGIEGSVCIKKTAQKSLVIPRNCIVGSIIKPMVYVVSNNVVKLRSLTVSSIINNKAIVTNGLSEGEIVVLSGQMNLEDNAKVVIQNSLNF
jgi:membrane fusion protein, multidrug efflux system